MGGRGGVWEVGEVGEVLVWPAMTVPRTRMWDGRSRPD